MIVAWKVWVLDADARKDGSASETTRLKPRVPSLTDTEAEATERQKGWNWLHNK